MQTTKSVILAKTGYIIVSVLIIIVGIGIILNPLESATVICNLAGGLLVVFGIVKLIGYFSGDLYRLAFQYDLAFGMLMVVIGIIMILHPWGTIRIFNICMGLLFLTDAVFRVQLSLDAKKFGIGVWWLIMAFAVMAGIFGTVLVVLPLTAVKMMGVILGLSFVSEGILNLFVALHAVEVSMGRHGIKGGKI